MEITQAASPGEGRFNVRAQRHNSVSIRFLSPPAPLCHFMETTQTTRSGQHRPSNTHAPMNRNSHGWKVNRRLKLARRRSGQAPSNFRTPGNHLNGGWKVKRSLKLACRHRCIHGNYASSEEREEKMISTPRLMQFMIYVPPLLLTLVTLKYQGKPQIIFRENPVPLWCFIATTCVYWLIVGAMKQMPTLSRKCFHVLRHAALASGIISAISLVSVFLPHPVSLLPLAVLISFLVPLALLYTFKSCLGGIECIIGIIHGILAWSRGSYLAEEASLPV